MPALKKEKFRDLQKEKQKKISFLFFFFLMKRRFGNIDFGKKWLIQFNLVRLLESVIVKFTKKLDFVVRLAHDED